MSTEEARAASCGAWSSPITANRIVGESTTVDDFAILGNDIYWTERRPREGGRTALVRMSPDGTTHDLTPPPFNVRTSVHEYGGGAFSVSAHGIFFCSFDDQQIYRVQADGPPTPLTHASGMRYANMAPDPSRSRLIAVREDHSAHTGEPINTLVAIDLDTGNEQVLVDGHDFFSNPAVSPDGSQLAWLTWDHPDMPWDGTELHVASFHRDGRLSPSRVVAGSRTESIFQPLWSPTGELHFVSDRTGWWNLYRERADGSIDALHPMNAEFGMPQWVFGMSMYGFDASGDIVCLYTQDGTWHLAAMHADGSGFESIPTPFSDMSRIRVGDDFAIVIGVGPTTPATLLRIDLADRTHRVVRSSRSSASEAIDPAYVSVAEPFTFPTEGGVDAHAFFYRPTNAAFQPPPGERPPLLVLSHGGPTSAAKAGFSWTTQFWTSRGFAVVDVNYGGSSGYGRAYRERLTGQWGVVDVDDAVNAARHLVARGDVDEHRVAIRGASAGGYTTLAALTFRDYFKAGASHYGIGDLETLARDTHKFESRYLDSLIGPYPAQRELYLERSPINHTERLSSPMILFQGADDKAVPPNQAQAMYDAVRAKGLPVAYLLFAGEGHGFRRAENIVRALEAELFFYGKIFGFAPADNIDPVAIDNLTQRLRDPPG